MSLLDWLGVFLSSAVLTFCSLRLALALSRWMEWRCPKRLRLLSHKWTRYSWYTPVYWKESTRACWYCALPEKELQAKISAQRSRKEEARYARERQRREDLVKRMRKAGYEVDEEDV